MADSSDGAMPGYRPTSLDYINRPNPVEPQSAPHRHPLNDSPHHPAAPNEDLVRLLLDATAAYPSDRPTKRRKTGSSSRNGPSLDLPKLPVRHNTKRLRIPPTLSGLHQPPPNAGLLPSISVEKPDSVSHEPVENVVAHPNIPEEPQAETTESGSKAAQGKPKRNKWSDDETKCLLKGVARFGIGAWTKILKCEDCHFEHRTALDLKDRFRVCCPENYRKKTGKPTSNGSKEKTIEAKRTTARNESKTASELQELGIDAPFTKNQRRKRHGYTAEEDEALLRGFAKYKNSWASIQQDEELGLKHRTSTDLRDRMRTKYPDTYKGMGLAPRPEVFPKPPDRGIAVEEDVVEKTPKSKNKPPEPSSRTSKDIVPTSSTSKQPPIATKRPQHAPPPLLPYDVFFGAPFGNEDFDDAPSERITLDRHILDWAGADGTSRPAAQLDTNRLSGIGTGMGMGMGIDPLITLMKLPRPGTQRMSTQQRNTSGGAPLPSFASVKAGAMHDDGGQIELPLLNGNMNSSFDNDGRSGGHILGMDELLS